MKKVIYLFIFTLLIWGFNVNALSFSVDELTINKGESATVDLYGNYTDKTLSDSFSLKFTTYDIVPTFTAESNVNLDYNNQIYNITFPEAVTGDIKLGTIDVKVKDTATATVGRININGTVLKINITDSDTTNQSITNTYNNNQDKNLLKLIKSNFTTIELKEDVFEYTAYIDDDLEKLDLRPIANNSDAVITVSSQVISELKNNQITIHVEDDGISADYIINVKQKKHETKKISNTETEKSLDKTGISVIVVSAIFVLFGIVISIKRK